jgi:beta-glucosidase
VSEAIITGLDLEMPGPPSWRTGILEHALNNRKILPHHIDDRVRGVLGAVKWATDNSGIKQDAPELGRNTPQDRALVRKAAADSIVLLKNDKHILPWKKSEIKKLAIIGPNAKVANTHGGGSAAVRSYYKVSPFEGLKNALKGVEILHAPGVAATRNAPSNVDDLRNAVGEPGFDFSFYNHGSDKVVHKMSLTETFIYFAHSKPPGLNKDFRAVASATFTPENSGIYEFGVEVIGKAKLYIKDTLVVDNWTHQTWGTSFTNNGSIEELGQIQLTEGVTYSFRIDFETGPNFGEYYVPHNAPLVEEGGGLRFGGGLKIDPEGGIAEAVKLASEADHVVIFAGLNVRRYLR